MSDLRLAARTLRKRPAFTLAAVATLALGIGGTTAIYSLLRAVLLDPLPYRDPSRLVMIWEDGSNDGLPSDINPTPANFVAWQEKSTSFDAMGAFDLGTTNLTGTGEPVRLQGYLVTHELFDVLGVAPALGRGFEPAEDRSGGPAVAILGWGLWQSRFGGSPAILGSSILLDDVPHTVVGVMPAGFDFPARGAEIWTPMAMSPELRRHRSAYVLDVVARLRDDRTLAQAGQEIGAMTVELNRDQPPPYHFGARLTTLRDKLIGTTRTAVLLLFAIAGSVLLIASANLANLVLARAVERHRDVAVRVALGAGRARVFRQLAAEHLLLSIAGAALGVLGAVQGLAVLERLVPRDLTAASVRVDGGLLAFAAALCVATTVLLGVAPSRLAWRLGIAGTLRQGDGRAGGSHRGERLRALLITAQTAFAVILVIAAGLILQTFLRVRAVDPGFRGERVLALRTELPVPRYADDARRAAFYSDVLERVQALPGVASAGYTSFLPLVFPGGGFGVDLEDRPEPSNVVANLRVVTSGYLGAMGVTLVGGRLLDSSDREGSERVAVVNRSMAKRFWPGEDPVGRRFRTCTTCDWMRVVGVVDDLRQVDLAAEARPECYVPYGLAPPLVPLMQPKDLAVRTSGDPRLLADAVRAAIWAVDAAQPIAQTRVMADYVADGLAPHRLQAQLTAAFAGFALLLASVGVYGVLSYTVAQRRHEMGIRLALGADRHDLVRWVMRRGLEPVIAGVAIGVVVAAVLARLIASLLYGVAPRDPLTFAVAGATLIAVAALACWLPARRASRVDPWSALRTE